MKLCYVWVEEYKGFKDFSLNLSSNYTFEYDYTGKVLTRRESYGFLEDLFDSSIKDITAIIGKNGAGKSNCLELICTVLQGSIKQFKTNFLAVIEEKDGYTVYGNTLQEIKSSGFNFNLKLFDGKINGFNTLFFSNVYDGRKFDFSGEVINATANNDYGYGMLNRSDNSRFDLISAQIDLIHKFQKDLKNEVGIDIPKEILIEVKLSSHSYKFDHKISGLFRSLRKRIKDTVNVESRFLSSIKYSILIDLVRVLEFSLKDDFESEKYLIGEKEYTSEYFSRVFSYSENIISSYLIPKLNNRFSLTSINNILNKIHVISDLDRNFDAFSSSLQEDNKVSSSILSFKTDFNLNNIEKLKKFSNAFSNERWVRVTWIGISSGSKAYLTLFSVLRDKLKGTRNDTLICIDEGDLYLHPSWQIGFLKSINKLLPKFFNGSIQLVLTSHSPFLLTDLPRRNVILLDERGVVNEYDKFNTFAANIYDLYNDAFFINGQRFGSLANDYIEHIISNITSGKDYDKEKADLVTSIIGDRLLKNQLIKVINK